MQLVSPANVVFHRVGGLDLTTRFQESELPVINDRDWKDESAAVEIAFSSGTNLQSAVIVREFVPRFGDVTGRRYTDARGNHHWINLPSYGLVDPSAYLDMIRSQIPKQARTWAATEGSAHREALRLINTGVAPELETLLQYDFGRYQKTRSAFITGPTRLGIQALPSDAEAMPSQSPLPRMITAQCDIVLTSYLTELLEKLFRDAKSPFLKRFLSNDAVDTHVTYVALRIITEGTVWILTDKERRDRQNNTTDRTLQVQLQDNLNNVIHTFSSTRFGLDYHKLESKLPLEAAVFYSDIENEADSVPFPAWKSPLFWLPTLHEVVTQPYVLREVFRPN